MNGDGGFRGHEEPGRVVRVYGCRERDHRAGAQLKPTIAKRTEKTLAKARTRDSMSAFSKLTEAVNGHVRIVDQSPLIVPIAELAGEGAATRYSSVYTSCCAA